MIGLMRNALGGTTVTNGGADVRGLTKREGSTFVAFVVRGRNMSRVGGSYDTDKRAVGAILARRV